MCQAHLEQDTVREGRPGPALRALGRSNPTWSMCYGVAVYVEAGSGRGGGGKGRGDRELEVLLKAEVGIPATSFSSL